MPRTLMQWRFFFFLGGGDGVGEGLGAGDGDTLGTGVGEVLGTGVGEVLGAGAGDVLGINVGAGRGGPVASGFGAVRGVGPGPLTAGAGEPVRCAACGEAEWPGGTPALAAGGLAVAPGPCGRGTVR